MIKDFGITITMYQECDAASEKGDTDHRGYPKNNQDQDKIPEIKSLPNLELQEIRINIVLPNLEMQEYIR